MHRIGGVRAIAGAWPTLHTGARATAARSICLPGFAPQKDGS